MPLSKKSLYFCSVTKEQTIKAEAIQKKIQAGQDLSREEDLFYLTVVFAYSAQEAETIIAIAENKNRLELID